MSGIDNMTDEEVMKELLNRYMPLLIKENNYVQRFRIDKGNNNWKVIVRKWVERNGSGKSLIITIDRR